MPYSRALQALALQVFCSLPACTLFLCAISPSGIPRPNPTDPVRFPQRSGSGGQWRAVAGSGGQWRAVAGASLSPYCAFLMWQVSRDFLLPSVRPSVGSSVGSSERRCCAFCGSRLISYRREHVDHDVHSRVAAVHGYTQAILLSSPPQNSSRLESSQHQW